MKNNFILFVGVGITISIFNPIPVTAKIDLDSNLNNYYLDKEQTVPLAHTLIASIQVNRQRQSFDSDKEKPRVSLERLAQTSSPQEIMDKKIMELRQQPTSDLNRLNPNANPLSFPTQVDEVEVGQPQPITLKQALELSLRNNKNAIEARIQVERSQAALRQARAALFPTLDLTSGLSPIVLTYENSGFLESMAQQEAELAASQGGASSGSFGGSSKFIFNPSLLLEYNIYDGGFRGALIRSAEKQLSITKLSLEITVEQTRLDTYTDYYSLQNSDAQVKIQQAAVRDARKTLSDAQLIEQSGIGTRFDVLRADAQLSQSLQNLTTAIANQQIASSQLAETLSVPPDIALATADEIEQVGLWQHSLPESIIQAFKNRAELEQFLLQSEIGEEQRQIALSQIRPTVSTIASYELNDDFEDEFDITDQYSVGLNLQWRLFDGGAAKAQAQQAEKDIELAKTQFANQLNQIGFEVKRAYFKLNSNQQNISTATIEVAQSEESLSMARLRFRAGIGTQTDVIDAQTQLTRSRGNLLFSIINYNQSYANLQRQVSNIPDNGLQDLP